MGKRLLIALVGLCLVFASASAERVEVSGHSPDVDVVVEQSTGDRTVVRFDIGAFEMNPVDINGRTFYDISVAHEANNLVAGQPDLPHVSRSIIIPDDAAMAINVLNAEYVDYPMMSVVPSKGNLLRTVNPEDVPYEFGREYLMTGFFPTDLAALREPYIMRDYRGIVIDINPFQYDAEHQTLRVYKSITVEVVTAGSGQVNVKEGAKRESIVSDFNFIYGNHFINYGESADKYTLVEETGSILIICYDAWMPDMQPLVDWKLQKGIPTVMVSKTTAGSSATGIKNYIQSYYDSTDVAFVLLIGDNAQLPTLTSGGGGADPMFALTDGGDGYPDLLLGRFSAENLTQLATQVNRTIEYERDASASTWHHKGTGIASNQGPGHDGGEYDNVHMGKIRDTLMMIGTYTEVDQIYDPSGTSSQVSAALNTGRSIINYCGHGSTTSWSTTGFSNTNVNALTNDDMLPFIFSVACVNGQFRNYTCFAEAWMRAEHSGAPTGAIGCYMSSINQSWDPPMDAQDEFNRLIVREVVSSYGAICFNGSCKMIDENGSGGTSMYNTWHIFGDPSVQVRTDSPAPLTVNHPGAVFFNVSEYEVVVVGEQGALCALYADGVLYGTAYTDTSGMALIPISTMLPVGAPVTLTVTSYNAETYIDEVVVTADLTVLHEGLTDTKDTLNDYQVDAIVYSDADLYLDSVFVVYDAGSGWTSVSMAHVGGDDISDSFEGFIPAQAAGTTVDYYLWAKNVSGDVDTTEAYGFFVIDYGVLITPEFSQSMAPVDDTLWYDLTVTNDGVLPDYYTLTKAGDVWDTELYDATGTSVVTQTTSLNGYDTFDFKVRVIVPSSFEDEYDSVLVTATSTTDGSYTDAAAIKSVSAGQPWPIPFTETFPTTSIEWTKWEAADGITIDGMGIGEPTEPYSANFDGSPSGGDLLETEQINLRNLSNVMVSYWYQHTGGGDAPEAGDDLVLEYLDSLGVWHEISRQLGTLGAMDVFEEEEVFLPGDAFHAGFRIRFSNTATSGNYDDWYVDDIFVGHPSDYEVMLAPYSQEQYGPAGDTALYMIDVMNRGLLADEYTLTVTSNTWEVLFYSADGMTPITQTATINGGDTSQFMVKVIIPTSAVPHDADQAMVHATSVGDPVMASYALVNTISGGLPIAFPIYEPFATTDLSIDLWFGNTGADVTGDAVNPPSTPYSLNLNTNSDTVTTRLIDLSGQDGAILSYYYEAGGDGVAPSGGDLMVLEYKNATGDWVEIGTYEGDGTLWTDFVYVNVPLPAEALHIGFQLRLIGKGDTSGDDWFVDDLRIDFAPEISCNPTSMDVMLGIDDSTISDLVVANIGPGTLTYSLNVQQIVKSRNAAVAKALDGLGEPAQRDYPAEFYDWTDVKGVDNPNIGYPVTRNYGGPDAFGYVWLDSDEALGGLYDFNWIDVSTVGTEVTDLTDDNYSGPHDIGFDFVYYGEVYSQFYIGSNGMVGFAPTGMNSRVKTTIPTATTPDNMICMLWDDLDPTNANNPGAHVYVHSDGNQCVIQFQDYPEYSAAVGDVMTAEVILFADGTVKLQYQTIAAGFDTESGTVGIENSTGTDGLEVAFATSYLHDDLAVTFVKPYQWLEVSHFSGMVAPGDADTVYCTMQSGTMEEGDYQANLVVHSNDPDPLKNPMSIPVNMTVTSGPTWLCADVDGNGTVADIADLVFMVDYMFNSGDEPPVLEALDVDGAGGLDIEDLVYLVAFMFSNGPAPHCGL